MKKPLFVLTLIISCFAAGARIKLPAIIGDSMVLQQKMNTPLWGRADAGEQITVKGSWPGAKQAVTTTGSNGRWMLKIATPAAGGPYTIHISGKEKIELKGVMIGEVWICSGQSNMEMPVQGWDNGPINNAKREVADAIYPSMRLFTVARSVAYTPQEDVTGEWASCTRQTAAGFSATAYFFGRELVQKLKVPVGLIHSSWGGTVAEAWTSKQVLHTLKDFDKELDKVDSIQKYGAEMTAKDKLAEKAWQEALTNKHLDFTGAMDDRQWKTMALPAVWETAGYPDMDGIVWFRKTINVPAEWAGRKLKLSLGPIDDYDVTYINTTEAGSTTKDGAWYLNRSYDIAAGVIKAGANVIAVRVTDGGGNGGLYGDKALLKLYPEGEESNAISLAGDWKYKVEAVKPVPVLSYNPNTPSVLYNGMIAPLIPFAIRGAIWYQGESNVGRNKQYEALFPAMIGDWRSRWKEGAFPFYYVQIAPFKYWGDSTQAAGLRDAQRKTLGTAANTGMAVTLDIGDLTNIHPSNKQEVGRRLSLWALANTYGQNKMAFSGPLYKSSAISGNTVTVSFSYTYGGLTAQNKKLSDFELAGADGIWHPAQATIKGDKVEVQSNRVAKPVQVRYAWYAAAEASLFNRAGLPASSFSSEK